jgi:2-methylcitrate dehydratase PrpD
MCDVYRPALCHVTPEVVPAALAAAEMADADGTQLLEAIATGLEVTTRVCLALDYPTFRGRGWHSPGVAGALGAGLAAGRLLGLSDEQLLGALGLAGAQAAGTFAAAGTPAVKFHQLNGARAGLSAAVHASNGMLGSPAVLTASDGGILQAYSDGGDPAIALRGLGDDWELTKVSLRRYPAASTLQSLIAALTTPLVVSAFDNGGIDRIAVALPPEAYRLGNGRWGSQLAAMQSARYVTSAALHLGDVWLDAYDDQNRVRGAVPTFAEQRVDVTLASDLPEGGVCVELSGEQPTVVRLLVAPGDPADPLTDQQVTDKLARCLGGAPRLAGSPNQIAEALQSLGATTSVRDLMGLLAAAETNAS